MPSYIDRLQNRRAALVAQQGGAQAMGGVGGVQPAGAQPDPAAPAGAAAPPLGPAGRPSPARQGGVPGVLVRQTIGDLFDAGAKAGLPGPLLAKHAAGLDVHLPALKDLARALDDAARRLGDPQRALIAALPGRLLAATSDGLLGLDPKSSSSTIKNLLAAVADLAALPAGKLSPAVARAIEDVAFAAARTGSPELGADVRAAAAMLTGADPAVVEPAARGIAAQIEVVRGAADGTVRSTMLQAGLRAALAGCADPRKDAGALVDAAIAALPGAVLSAGQRDVLRGVVDAARADQGARAQQNDAADAVIAQRRPALAALPGVQDALAAADARLPRPALATFVDAVAALAHQPEANVRAAALVMVEVLDRAAGALPPPAEAAMIAAAAARLPALGVTDEGVRRVARDHASKHAPLFVAAALSLTTTALEQLAGKGVPGDDDALAASIADALVVRTEPFARQNHGALPLLVDVLAAAPAAARAGLAGSAARLSEAVAAMEVGPQKDAALAKLPADTAFLVEQGVDPAQLAAAHPLIPEDSLARLAAIGIAAGKDPDAWLGELEPLCKEVKKSKEATRALRSLFVCAAEGGADVPGLVAALGKAALEGPRLTRLANALLNENARVVTKDQIDGAVAMLGRGEDVASAIEAKLHQAMVQRLGLDALLQNVAVKATPEGMAALTGDLAQFLTSCTNNGGIDKALLQGMAVAVLEDRFGSFRFTTPPADTALASLSPKQRKAWETNTTAAQTHIRFDAGGQEAFDRRVTTTAKIGGALLGKMTATWGKLDDLRKQQTSLADEHRALRKDDRAGRLDVARRMGDLPTKIEALEWATKLAALTPQTTTPLTFQRLSDDIPEFTHTLGPGLQPALNELLWTVRIDDLAYSEVRTNDATDLTTMSKLARSNCLAGDPPAVLAYCLDPNKRMIVTKNTAGEMRRAIMRLVERQDAGHEGQPMLLLERTYPDKVSQEEKQRLVEHMLRRAVDMGVPAAYATEYYFDTSKTSRGQSYGLVDMNDVLADLNARYGTTSEKIEVAYTNKAGNMANEYLDSAPPQANMRGVIGMRKYPGNVDTACLNEFVVLTPKV